MQFNQTGPQTYEVILDEECLGIIEGSLFKPLIDMDNLDSIDLYELAEFMDELEPPTIH